MFDILEIAKHGSGLWGISSKGQNGALPYGVARMFAFKESGVLTRRLLLFC